MKKTLLLSSIIALGFNSSAQVFSEDWTAPQAWTIAQGPSDTDTNTWYVASTAAFAAQGNVAASNSWISAGGGTVLTPDNFIISPIIDMTTVSGPLALSFKLGSPETTASGFYEEFISVYVFDGINGLAGAMASPVHSQVLAGGEMMYPFTYDVSNFAGADSVFIAFRHHNCTDENFVVLDDINIISTASIDEATISSSVYPNPTSDILNIVSSEKIISITITSLDGKMIKNETSSSIVVEELKSGIYMYSVITESGKTSQGNFVKN